MASPPPSCRCRRRASIMSANEAARQLARAVNEHAAKMRAAHPTRFGHFASVPMPDVDGTLTRDRLCARYAEGRRHPVHDELWRALSGPSRFDAGDGGAQPAQGSGFRPSAGARLLRAVCSLGFSRRSSNSRKTPTAASSASCSPGHWRAAPTFASSSVIPAAAVPVLAGRAAVVGLGREFAEQDAATGIDHELRKLHYDVALQANRPALAALFAYVPLSQVLLGSDYPFGTSARWHSRPRRIRARSRANSTRSIAAMPHG